VIDPVHTLSDVNRWLPQLRDPRRARVRLFCFPYAGGSVSAFSRWSTRLPSWIDLRPLQLPGRGTRRHEPSLTSLSDVVARVVPLLVPLLDIPFALFGHSMGALIAFETARELQRLRQTPPVHLYVSGRRGPRLVDDDLPPSNAPDAEFIEELRRLNGTPPMVLEDPVLMNLALPSLRADFGIVQTYRYRAGEILSVPITLFAGVDDQETADGRGAGWFEETTGPWTLTTVAGDHFFLHASAAAVTAALAGSLRDALHTTGPTETTFVR
jgi:medium-chain acyl-[acyl-carrier-protein] hydrolase